MSPFQLFAESLINLSLSRNGYRSHGSSPGVLRAHREEDREFEVPVRSGKRPARKQVAAAHRAEVLDHGRTILLSRALAGKIVFRDPKVDVRVQPSTRAKK